MHLAEVIHGDLTTSNMMVRLLTSPSTPNDPVFEVVSWAGQTQGWRRALTAGSACNLTTLRRCVAQVLIDFGLSSVAVLPEDRAVDLYVLERAFASTHPVPEGGAAHFDQVLLGYQRAVEERGKKGEWARIEKRLEEVRGRGRKRSMVG